jgi:hypothetical protein
MSSQLAQLQDATIKQHCKTLRMPMMASQFSTLAEIVGANKPHIRLLFAFRRYWAGFRFDFCDNSDPEK